VTDFKSHLSMPMEAREAPQAQNGVPVVQHELDVSIVMPCLNEEEAITGCVEEALAAIESLGITGEVLVVDNDSSDRSARLAVAAGARVVTEADRGYGNAYRRGFLEARGRVLVMGDADGTYDFSALRSFFEPLLSDTDMVVGTRLRGSIDRGAMPWLHRYVGNPFLTATMNLLGMQGISDVYCGMRSLKRDVASLMSLTTSGMEFALEMLIEAKRMDVRISEIPIRYRQRQGGRPKLRTWRDGWKSFRFIVSESLQSESDEAHHLPSLGHAQAAPSESGP
jgi:glycosyltransferase involved in cell wall biosynthesis